METQAERLAVEREIAIAARPETVWELLTDPAKARTWWGVTFAFDPRPGGAYSIEVVPGKTVAGEFVELDPPRRLVYTWGWVPDGDGPNLVPPGSSTVEIELEGVDGGTRLSFTHRDLPNAESAQSHAEGWDHYLGRLATVAQGGDPGRDPWLGEPA